MTLGVRIGNFLNNLSLWSYQFCLGTEDALKVKRNKKTSR